MTWASASNTLKPLRMLSSRVRVHSSRRDQARARLVAMTTAGTVRAGSERRDEILAIAAQLFAERGFASHDRPRDRRRRRHPVGQPLPPLRLEGVDGRRAGARVARSGCSPPTERIIAADAAPEVALRALVREAFAAIAHRSRDGHGDAQRVRTCFVHVPSLRVPARDLRGDRASLGRRDPTRCAVGRVPPRPRPADALPVHPRRDLGDRAVVPARRPRTAPSNSPTTTSTCCSGASAEPLDERRRRRSTSCSTRSSGPTKQPADHPEGAGRGGEASGRAPQVPRAGRRWLLLAATPSSPPGTRCRCTATTTTR